MHAVGKEVVAVIVNADGATGVEIVAAPARICYDGVSGEQVGEQGED